ncbi:MAG TPA: hypothetical protein PLN32_09195 [Methanoregulaceae archaeon]|nr:hypothetical protein [Methanoregulaceae archaeon]
MAMNSKKKFILDVMNKGILIPINRCPPWILSEKRMVMRDAGAIYPCIAGRGFHPIMGLSVFSNETHFVIFIIYARIPKSGLIGGLYENASGISIFYACGPQRNRVIFIRGSSLLQMPALSPLCGGNQELPAREKNKRPYIKQVSCRIARSMTGRSARKKNNG